MPAQVEAMLMYDSGTVGDEGKGAGRHIQRHLALDRIRPASYRPSGR
jgi:hypothetical protein